MIVLGADTHKRSHTIAAVSAATGELMAEQTVQVGIKGFAALVVWARELGTERVWATSRTDCLGRGSEAHHRRSRRRSCARPAAWSRRGAPSSFPPWPDVVRLNGELRAFYALVLRA